MEGQEWRQRSSEELAWLESLATHKEAWESLGDPVATSIMTTGLRLEFHTQPPLTFDPPPHAVTKEANAVLICPFLPDWLRRGVYSQEDKGATAPLFFQSVRSRERRSVDPSYHKFEGVKSVSSGSIFQNGNSSKD